MVWLLFFIAVGFVFFYKGKFEQADRLRSMHCRLSKEWEDKYHAIVREVTNKK